MLHKLTLRILVISLVFSIIGLSICNMAFAQKKYLMYFIPHSGAGDPFWSAQKSGWDTACSMLPVQGIFSAPPKFNPKEQAELVGAAMAAGADGIAVTIPAPEMMRDPLFMAKKKGIPVITICLQHYPAQHEEKLPYMGFIGQNELITGRTLAERVLKEFRPTRAVHGIHHAGNIVHEIRGQGIIELMKKNNIPIEKVDVTPEPARGVGILDAYLKRHPDTNMIFTTGPLGTAASVTLIREKGLQGKVRLATMDVNPLTLDAIKKGEMMCTLAQQPFMQGFLGATALYLHLRYGFTLPDNISTGPTIIDKNNLDQVEKQVSTTGAS